MMKKPLLPVFREIFIFFDFMFSNIIGCITLIGLVIFATLFINQNIYAMASIGGDQSGNTTTANQAETKGKIIITEKQGYLYEKKASGEFALKKEAEKVAYKIGPLSVDELKKKLTSSDYMERVWAYFYFRVRTNFQKDVEFCFDGEEGWEQIIRKLIVDLFLSLEESGNADMQRQDIMIILEGFDKKFIEYIRKTEITNYSDPEIRRMLVLNLEKVANQDVELNSAVIFIISKLKNDSDTNVKRTAIKIIERLSLK